MVLQLTKISQPFRVSICISLTISLGGADFEIIPTNNIFSAHHLWAGSLHFPPRARCFFHGRQVRPEKSEATRPIQWYQPRTGYAPLRFWCRSLWAWRWRIVAIIGLHCLSKIGILSQNRNWIWRRKLAQLLYLVVTPFCTRSRGLVLKPQSLPHRVHFESHASSRTNFKPLSKKDISKSDVKNGQISRFCFVFQVIQVILSGKFCSAEVFYLKEGTGIPYKRLCGKLEQFGTIGNKFERNRCDSKDNFLSVCIWFQEGSNLLFFLPCPIRPHPHRSRCGYFSICIQFLPRVAPHFFVSTIR